MADFLRVLCSLRVGKGQLMKSIRSIVAVCALAVLVVPHATPGASTPFDSAESGLLAQGGLSQLRGIEELKSWFNTFKGHPRLIFLVSPT